MAMRLMPPEEFEHELTQRNCQKLAKTSSGYDIWQDEKGNPFSVPPSEEMSDGKLAYPDWMLDDLIQSVGLPKAKIKPH
ncbi:MAG: hypothetical protein EXQ96_08310 [Alphaproteobacteria bacterium]|nr:hypothetical protein [Alphaproteobacteria bacterium]